MSFTPNLLSLFPPPTADSLGLSDADAAWLLEPDADPAQMQMQLSDIGPTDIEIPDVPDTDLERDGQFHPNVLADIFTGQDSPAGYQTSNDSSLSVPVSRSPSTSSALFLWSPSSPPSSAPHHRLPFAEAQMHVEEPQAKLCTSKRCGSETCLAAALRILKTLHIAHSACLSAHREAPAVQQTRKMETVLSTNKDVVAGMDPILACSCSARSLVQLLLLSLCGNLIAWNSAMISADFDQSDDTYSPASALSANLSQTPRARVLTQPITIGQHQIGGKLGRVLHAQVMAGELRILEGLVDALSRRFAEVPKSDVVFSTFPTSTDARNVNSRAATASEPSSWHSQGLANNVHRHIISSLRTRLENTRALVFSHN
ncbi:uncharacterized protein GLRG_08636 [Colletotrichum graminicola M1.001]|uniref:Aflatoxin regulatory protein domain-containing protein n=1 Tax=Colletotrichum graminicola (strain M1.001 / M2 / FGSC 10212) TaxID=645133 RepID=E3QS69_COLGM|nr:uncharacterized protein GLRG_08636 [Colletotrichum graminicola M1.001]EFQ33707.1 hypothetical protein GLRG_08636 [Colletotrichum graminicola M1.001]